MFFSPLLHSYWIGTLSVILYKYTIVDKFATDILF